MGPPSWDAFGKLLMERVRDKAIEEWNSLIEGRMKGDTAKRIHEDLQAFSVEQRKVLQELIPEIVDATLHHLMWTIEQREEVSLRMAGGPELRTVSDGLAGDLEIWKERYSQQRSYGEPNKPS